MIKLQTWTDLQAEELEGAWASNRVLQLKLQVAEDALNSERQ